MTKLFDQLMDLKDGESLAFSRDGSVVQITRTLVVDQGSHVKDSNRYVVTDEKATVSIQQMSCMISPESFLAAELKRLAWKSRAGK